MSHVLAVRSLFAMVVGFHVILSTIGVGMPLMILIAEVAALWTRNPAYRLLAKRWTRGFVVLLGVGVVSGTIVAVQLTMLFPAFMRLVGQVIALPFLIEVFAFFLEALFAGIYIYAGDRMGTIGRLASSALVAIGAGLSAILITDVDSFMNTPQGFRIIDGQVTDIHPWQAAFNPAMPTASAHVLSTAYLTVAFLLAMIAAWRLLRPGLSAAEAAYHRLGLQLTSIVGVVMGILTAVIGDLSGKFLASAQPIKLAAEEGLFQGGRDVPLNLLGMADAATRQTIGGINLPGMLSWLATGRVNGLVKGLDSFPQSLWPPLFIHPLFDLMVLIGGVLIVVALLVLAVGRSRREPIAMPRWLLGLVVASGPLSMLGIEMGWIQEEVGRQPWVVTGVLTTTAAATKTPMVGLLFFLFLALYLVLSVATISALVTLFRKNPLGPDLDRLESEAVDPFPAGTVSRTGVRTL